MLDLGKHLDFVFVTYLVNFSILLNSRLLTFSPGAVPKDAVRFAPAKALKTGARSTPHTATQPQPAVDLEAAAARLREAMARGAQAAQQARAQEEDDAGQSGAEAAAPADDAEETGRGGAGGAAQAAIEVAGQTEEDTLAPEPPRDEG